MKTELERLVVRLSSEMDETSAEMPTVTVSRRDLSRLIVLLSESETEEII